MTVACILALACGGKTEGTELTTRTTPEETQGGSSGHVLPDACFGKGTRIATATGSIAIEDVRVGDEVRAFDLAASMVVDEPVTEVFVHASQRVGVLQTAFGPLRVTPNHPIFDATTDSFVAAGSLLDSFQSLELVSIESTAPGTLDGFSLLNETEPVYNLTVANRHTYFANGLLVHNKSRCGYPGDAADCPCLPDESCGYETPSAGGAACVTLTPPEPQPGSDELQIAFACGTISASRREQSDFVSGGQRCRASDGLNTFALKLSGSAAGRYSAVVRCGYIRYDNGTFVGERVAVEARDGAWCHDQALARIELVDRMLLTDVSFSIEATGAAEQYLAVGFETRSGWTELAPAEHSLCAYVAFREPGGSACGMVPSAAYCVCPCGSNWQDFFQAMTLSLATR